MQTNMKNNNKIYDVISSFEKKHNNKMRQIDYLNLLNLAGQLEKTLNEIRSR